MSGGANSGANPGGGGNSGANPGGGHHSGAVPVAFRGVTFAWPETDEPIYTDLTLDLPDGFTFVVGANGVGKSTMMLLGAGRIFPESGTITLAGVDTSRFENAGFEPALEAERNLLCSFVYQNMEFASEEPLGALLEQVAAGGNDPTWATAVAPELVSAARLESRTAMRLQELSKGELQAAIVVMSVLFASPVVFMDEPVFAAEPATAARLLGLTRELGRARGTSSYLSVHDVELARSLADSVILIPTDRAIAAGPAAGLLTRDALESAFRAPFDTLYRRQSLYRDLMRRALGDDSGSI